MKRKILKISIIVLLAGLLCGVYYYFFHVPKYYNIREDRIDDEVIAEFYEHREEYQQVADIVRNNKDYWDYYQRERDVGHAYLHDPYRKKEMQYFSETDRNIIVNFFETFLPSSLEVNYQETFVVVYGDAEGGLFYLVYYYADPEKYGAKSVEEYIDYYLSYKDYYIDLGENWYFFGNN